MSLVSGRLLLTVHRPQKEQLEDASVHVFIRKLTTRHPPMLNPYRTEATPSLVCSCSFPVLCPTHTYYKYISM